MAWRNLAEQIFLKINDKAKSKTDKVCVLLAIGESTQLRDNGCSSRKTRLKLAEETFGRIYELLKGSGTQEEHDILLRYFSFLQQSSTTAMDAVPLAREFLKKYPEEDPNYPWMLRAVLIYELSRRNVQEVKRIYKKIQTFKNSDEIQKQFTNKEHGYFIKYGYDPQKGMFTKPGK